MCARECHHFSHTVSAGRMPVIKNWERTWHVLLRALETCGGKYSTEPAVGLPAILATKAHNPKQRYKRNSLCALFPLTEAGPPSGHPSASAIGNQEFCWSSVQRAAQRGGQEPLSKAECGGGTRACPETDKSIYLPYTNRQIYLVSALRSHPHPPGPSLPRILRPTSCSMPRRSLNTGRSCSATTSRSTT